MLLNQIARAEVILRRVKSPYPVYTDGTPCIGYCKAPTQWRIVYVDHDKEHAKPLADCAATVRIQMVRYIPLLHDMLVKARDYRCSSGAV